MQDGVEIGAEISINLKQTNIINEDITKIRYKRFFKTHFKYNMFYFNFHNVNLVQKQNLLLD